MTYPIKTLAQLPLLLKALRKEQGLTQAAVAEKLGITQQSYAHFEAKPAMASLERLFTVLRLLNVDISLTPATPAPEPAIEEPAAQGAYRHRPAAGPKPARTAPPAVPPKQKESW